MSIRDTFSYIEGRYVIPEYRKIKTPFLMAVLRIADYVQVQSERALKSLLSVKELRSPVSRQEWRNHFAVRDVSTRHDDPEALYVHAAPTDVRTYLKLVALFKDIQRELDQSWATIGEVYGRRGDLAPLGLSLRRIRSNLDKTDVFASSVSYIPIKAGFDASGPDLLKLLVGPLYDYSHPVGIRELVQNAVDACRELADLEGRELRDTSSNSEIDVTVEFQESEDGTGWISVSDKGVGMTLETVINYFLIAGASFRNSDLWKRQHVDEQGQSRVLRGGRFGVGALAAFLLGEEIKVRTRHVSAEADGLEFTARMDDPVVELRRCPAPVGTSIQVWISNSKVFDEFRPYISQELITQGDGGKRVVSLEKWQEVDWFAQSNPKVKYVWSGFDDPKPLSGGDRVRVRAEFAPSSDSLVPVRGGAMGDWRSLSDCAPYEAIYWRYLVARKEHTTGHVFERLVPAEITVNGIRVQKLRSYNDPVSIRLPQAGGLEPYINLSRPSIAIFDPAGVCPINLQRSAIAFDRMGLDERLAKDILLHHVRKMNDDAKGCLSIGDFQELCSKLAKQETLRFEGQVSPICALSTGVTLTAAHALAELELDVLFFVNSNGKVEGAALENVLDDGEALLFRQGDRGIASDLSWFRGLFGAVASNLWYSSTAGFPHAPHNTVVSIMPEEKWRVANEKGKVSRQILGALQHRDHKDGYAIVTAGHETIAKRLERRLDDLLKLFGDGVEVSAWALVQGGELPDINPTLYSIWKSVVGGVTCSPKAD